MGNIDTTQPIREASELEQGSSGQGLARWRGIVLQVTGPGDQLLSVDSRMVRTPLQAVLRRQHSAVTAGAHALRGL